MLPDYRELRAYARLTGGASQETSQLDISGADYVYRLAFRREAGGQPIKRSGGQAAGLLNEARLLYAARRAGVPVPEVLAEFVPSDGLGEGFLMPW